MPTLETINVGLAPNDKKGDPLRDAMQKVILNFSALNTAIQGVLDTKGQANGFASLDGNGRLLAAQAPIVYATALPTSAHDLNDFIAPGTYHQNTNVGATTGTHYPTPYAGLLLVRASATNFLYQFYTRFRSGPGGSQATYWRTYYANVWCDWQEVAKKAELDALSTAVAAAIPLVQKGAANGVASLDSSGHLPAEQAPIMYAAVLPTATHTLNDYITPGVWYQASIAGATAGGASYPTAQVGFLEVVATGTPVLQVFTTRNATPAIQQQFWRVRVTSTTWSNWKEVVDTTIAYTYQGGLASGVNLNDLTQRGTWVQASSAAAAAGTNYPVAQSGYLSVLSAGYPGGTAATGCSQIYHAANSNRLFFRALVNSTWTDWVEVGRLDANGRIPNTQFPLSVSNPAGTDANNLTSPGLYYNNSDAQATAVLNWPEQLAGSLFVEAAEVVAGSANQQITQTYTTRNGSGGVLRTYKRVRFGGGAGVWGLWQQLARYDDAMTHVFLTAATDFNTLTADNTFYTWRSGTVVTAGTNGPPVANVSGGYVDVRWTAADYIIQTVVVPAAGAKPRIFQRFGSGTTWQAWKIISPVSSTAWLPTADAGDVEVDGSGVHRWNAAVGSYVWAPPTPTHRQGLKTEWSTVSALTVYPGMCASADGAACLQLSASNTRTVQSSGAFTHAATGNGLLTGARTPNTWYYIFLLRRNSDGAVCVAFDTTFNCANRPATHSHYRRIGQCITNASNELWKYVQYGNEFWLDTSFDLWSTAPLIANGAYSPSTYTPPNVAHIVRMTGYVSSTGGTASLLQRFRNKGRDTAYQYVVVAGPSGNSIGSWEVPMDGVPNPIVSFLVGPNDILATVKVIGYVDLFED